MKKQTAGTSGFYRIRVVLALTLTVAAAFLGIAAIAQAQKSGAATPAAKTAWPLLEDQLTQKYYDRAVEPGSALEALIRANQDFSILREAEATDKRGLPLWLRVYWRKAHPEGKYSADDPTGGYPHVLKEILEWMMTHQDLKATEDTPGARNSEQEQEQEPDDATPGANVRISGAQTVARSESDVRINYFDPTKIISASNNIGGNGRQGIYYSGDSGGSWTQTFLPLTSPDTFHSDPTVDWTSDSRAWSSTLGIQGGTLRMRNYVSVDNGANWTLDATVSGSQTAVDKQMVWVDHSASSPFKDQMYAIWHNNNPAFMNRRTAGASGTWLAAPIQVSGAETTGTAIGGDVKTNSFGDVFGAWPATGNSGLFVVKSTNGGNSFGTPVLVVNTYDSYDIGIPSFNSRRVLIYTSLGAYRTASKNNVYLTWADLSGDAGCTAPANEPKTTVTSTCKTRIWFSRSVDGGATWSPRVKINNQAGLNDQFNPWMAVDESNGTIGIMYYDTVADAGRKKTDVWYQSSTNDGVSWSTAVKVTTAMSDETISGADSGNQYGDYNALSAYNTVFFPSWTDRRSGAKEEIWTSKILDAPGAPNVVGGTSSVSDGRVSPGQTATLSLCVQNVGTQNAANVVGTLQATGGVTNPSSAQTYGAMTAGGPAVCKSFTFTVNPALPCGSSVTATLALQDGATAFTPASYTFATGVAVTTSAQNFDSVAAPVLPSGWVASNASGAALWVTSATSSDTGVNNAFVDDPGSVSDKRLETPGIFISSTGAIVRFRNNYDLEGGATLHDGGVLEVSSPNINAGAYTDILDAAVGGSFVSGGYSGTLSSAFGNPIGGRQAWSGNSGGYITTVANLGPNVAGQTIKLRFRMGSDATVGATGWRIDSLTISYPSCETLTIQQPPTRQANGHILFKAIGYPYGIHTIEAASNPNTANFGPIGTATADSAGNVQYDDADAVGLTTRFYRLKYP